MTNLHWIFVQHCGDSLSNNKGRVYVLYNDM
jgi:hypothetical protein